MPHIICVLPVLLFSLALSASSTIVEIWNPVFRTM